MSEPALNRRAWRLPARWLRWRDPAVRQRRIITWTTIAVGYIALMGILAVVPVDVPEISGVSLDKGAHVCEYWLLTWLAFRAARFMGIPRRAALRWIGITAIGYGALLEGVQLLLPYRSAEWMDIAANAVGVALGAWMTRSRVCAQAAMISTSKRP